nr:unnamed protein product [Digitaria exilis]
MAGKRVAGGDGREEDGAKVGLPALELARAFPQATPASIFPPSVSDYYQLDDLLTNEERSIRKNVRGIMEKEIAPIMSVYWEKAEFPFNAIPKLASLGVAGGTIKGYGCPGLSITASAVTMAEIARVDASCSTFILVHSSLAMVTIALCGSEAQKQKYLPSLAQLTAVGCWALTEPDYGSDASSLRTTATKAWTSRTAREVVFLGRELLGGNGILADFLVAKAFCDLEPIYSYEGTYDINSLVTGREITGIASFKPATLAKARL